MKYNERTVKMRERRGKVKHPVGRERSVAAAVDKHKDKDKRNRGKRSGVDAVKLYIQTAGNTGRTSRSATTVIILSLNKN